MRIVPWPKAAQGWITALQLTAGTLSEMTLDNQFNFYCPAFKTSSIYSKYSCSETQATSTRLMSEEIRAS